MGAAGAGHTAMALVAMRMPTFLGQGNDALDALDAIEEASRSAMVAHEKSVG